MRDTKRRAIVVVAFGLACLLPVAAEAASRAASKTHLGTKASALIRMVTSPTATAKGASAAFREAGTGVAFTMPEKTVLVITDVLAFNCRGVGGSYVAAIVVSGSGSTVIPIYFDTTVDGQQKEIHFTSGVVFSHVPELSVSDFSVSDLCVQVLGYLVKDQ